MTRRIVCRENSEVMPGTFLAPGALQLPSHPIAVTWPYMAPHQPIGTAKEFHRDDATGAISFEIKLVNDEEVKPDDLSIYATNLITFETVDRDGEWIHIVIEATIREICYRPFNERTSRSQDLQGA